MLRTIAKHSGESVESVMKRHVCLSVCLSQWCVAWKSPLWQAINDTGLLFWRSANSQLGLVQKRKASPYSITKRRVPELIPVYGSQPARDVSHNLAVGCNYFPPGLQLPLQPLRGLLPISLLGEQRHDGCEQTVTRQRRGYDLNPGPSAPESSRTR